MRRAAELTALDPEASESGLTEAEVLRIAGEVGLPEKHVRVALAEVRARPPDQGALRVLFGAPVVRASRVIPQGRDDLCGELDEFLVAGQLLQPVRRTRELMVYWPAVDWVSQIARAASSTSRRYYVASAKSVEIHLKEIGPAETAVEFEVDPGTRNNNLAGGIAGGVSGGVGAGVGVALGMATFAPTDWAVMTGVTIALAVGTLVLWAVGLHHRRQNREVRTELEGILDRLEEGETLEPPPASWRRWVRRHFGGVAREVVREWRSEEE